jgi:hypothetical protein
MLRVVMMSSLLVAACGKDEPPPDPICDRVMSTFDKVATAVNTFLDKGPKTSPAVYCGKLELAVKGATAFIGDDIEKHIQPALDKLDSAALKCMINGIASTQEMVKKDLVQVRARIAAECAK